jgi:flagellar motility protein MotE (MotC chaperone)
VTQPQRPSRVFAVLSALLLVTGCVLLGAALLRLPALAALWGGHRPPTAAVPTWLTQGPLLGAIEPASGPEAPVAAAAPPEPAPVPEPAPPAAAAESEPATLAALEAMAAELGRHRADLDERERRLVLREAVTAAVEDRIGQELARLDQRQAELERLSGQIAAEDEAKIQQLVKVYEAMKAKNAAAIFDPMALDLLLPIVRGMRETKVAAIVAEMDPAKARALTAEMARRRELPPGP